MDPKQVQLIIFIEEMIALAAKSVADLRLILANSHTQTVDEILADADATYQKIIDNAKNPPTGPAPPASEV
jgi:hypothetical protein